MGRAKEIIVVDDDHDILDLVQTIIEDVDNTAHVHLFDNTESALEEVGYSGDDVDLIVTDFCVPKLNGDKFAARVQECTSCTCPIILFSGSSSIHHTDFGSLFTNKISKSNPTELLSTIHHLLNT